MLIQNFHARILHLGEVKDTNNGFKKCYVTVETKEKRNEFDEVVYQPEKFECEVALDKEGKKYEELKALAPIKVGQTFDPNGGVYFPATFNLRAFTYQESGKEKLGKQLQLKRWTR